MTLAKMMNTGETTPEVDVAETARVWEEQSAQLVDVREPREWAEGHMPGAVHIPLGDLIRRASELDKSRPVIAICRSGHRSLAATDALLDLGFSDVASMNGGMIAWAKAGKPIER
ncbi:MAG: rhodanese-like domain-containing protein [Chloroflexota bacterium]|nr:rhodanese-like domain-containing protein [Chloroflexota bacterium]